METNNEENKFNPENTDESINSTDQFPTSNAVSTEEDNSTLEQIDNSTADANSTRQDAPLTVDSLFEMPADQPTFNPDEQNHDKNKEKAGIVGSLFKKYFPYVLVAGVVISALISVIAVLTGDFGQTMMRSLSTTVTMVVHTLIILFFISLANKVKNKSGLITLNTIMVIAIASFVISVLSIWNVITGIVTADLYIVFFNTFLASLWIQLLMKIGSNNGDRVTKIASNVSIGVTVAFYLIIIPSTFANTLDKLPDIYYRSVAAMAIILATSTILTVVFHRMYTVKHPDADSLTTHFSALDVIAVFFLIIFGIPFITTVIINAVTLSYDTTRDRTYETRQNINNSINDTYSMDRESYTKSSDETSSGDINRKSVGSHASAMYTNCATIPPYSDEREQLTATNYTFVRLDTLNQIYYATRSENPPTTVISSYKVLPKILTADCTPTSWSALVPGTNINIYTSSDNSNLSGGTDYIQIITP